MIVADADLTSYRVIRGSRSEVADAVYARDSLWIAPDNHRTELLNVVSKNVRRLAITLEQGIAAYSEAIKLIKYRRVGADDIDLLRLSVQLRTTTYDAVYVSLARQMNLIVVTGDAGLVGCAPDIAVSMEDFAAGK